MGIMDITISGYENLMHEIQNMQGKGKKVINRTIGDFKKRGPGWISQEIVKEYNIKKADINEHKKGVRNKGTARVRGVRLDQVQLVYQGRVLTPTHFGMKPKARPARGPYIVTAQIKKTESRKPLGERGVFLAASGREGTMQIPFQRQAADTKRLPIEVIKTVSVPQMITNEKVSEDIHSRINIELGKRLEHHLKQVMK